MFGFGFPGWGFGGCGCGFGGCRCLTVILVIFVLLVIIGRGII